MRNAAVGRGLDPDRDTALLLSSDWYLGIDVGTTAIAAALFNPVTQQTAVIGWHTAANSTPHRLAAVMPLLSTRSRDWTIRDNIAPSRGTGSIVPGADHPYLQPFKPYLNCALPYWATATQTWEPRLAGAAPTGAWRQIRQALPTLLATLWQTAPDAPLTCTATGMSATILQTVLHNLAGVVMNCPTGWSEAYRFNLREAVLAAKLVTNPAQIFFVEDAIAALLMERPQAYPGVATLGATLVVSAGASLTELLLGELPAEAAALTRDHVCLHSLAYAGDAIDQDIICQLLYPTAQGWEPLELKGWELPLPGEPDRRARQRFQQQLVSSPLGQSLLQAACRIKLAFHHHSVLKLRLQGQQWLLQRSEFQQRVMLPYLQRLNRELNRLLTQTGMAAAGVRQIICTGGTAQSPMMSHWLKQKFPHAALHLETDLTQASCSRVAQGLAQLPLYPQMVQRARHQYSDLFLLRELLCDLPTQPLTLGRILQRLENRGINTQVCQRSILNLLEGNLPAGFLPSSLETDLLATGALRHPDYQALAAAPLFLKPDRQTYCLNPDLRDRFQQYFTDLLAHTHQNLEEPLPYLLRAIVPCPNVTEVAI